jgi:hydroxymethylpyrimidine pyrophosphatase-like HAD family hydrolase
VYPGMQIRAVVTDLDGTIAGEDGSVGAATVQASRELMKKGIPLIAATARTPNGLAVLRPLMPAITAAVCCNGSLGHDTVTGRPLWRQTLCAATVTDIVSIVTTQLPDAGIGAFDSSRWILTENYLAVRGRQPRGPIRVAGRQAFADADVCALAVCHPCLPSDQIARHLLSAGVTQTKAVITALTKTCSTSPHPAPAKDQAWRASLNARHRARSSCRIRGRPK